MIYNKSYRSFDTIKTRLTIDEFKAKEIARRFLEQYHSIIVSDVLLEDDVWTVSAKTGLMPKDVKKVMIDAETGRILGYS
ncbi:hypothetical protein DYY66_2366 [Candidatus Nitrosotalea sp. FS]|nr:hypothetical protein [Candidatus Nitrosotalea sp. FS]